MRPNTRNRRISARCSVSEPSGQRAQRIRNQLPLSEDVAGRTRTRTASRRGLLIDAEGPVLWRRESGTVPSGGTELPRNQDVHEAVSHQNNSAARFGVAGEDRGGFRGTLARGAETLDAD